MKALPQLKSDEKVSQNILMGKWTEHKSGAIYI